MCGGVSRCWWCDVHRIAPDVAGKGKVRWPFIWIFLRPFKKCRKQAGNGRCEVSRDASYRCTDPCIDYLFQLCFGLSFGLIDRKRDLLVDGLLSKQLSLPSFL
jgi:hypothetical protein